MLKLHDVTVFCARSHRFRCARLEPAAQVKMMRVVAPDGLGDNPKIGLGEKSVERLQILDDRWSRQARRG